MINKILTPILLIMQLATQAQFPANGIRSTFVLQNQRENIKTSLHLVTIYQTFTLPLNKETEYRYQSAFWSISQFMVYNDTVVGGFRKTMKAYNDSLDVETRRSFLEAMHTVQPPGFTEQMIIISKKEKNPKLYAMIQLWLFNMQPKLRPKIIEAVEERYKQNISSDLMEELVIYMKDYTKKRVYPPIQDLFAFQHQFGQKTVYSFQQWNRDFPGIAVIQYEDGHFARDKQGNLITIQQLARSASSLPYFITNGNTPQGFYRISGIDTSHNNFIGPTPNLQLIMPNEYYCKDFFLPEADTTDQLAAYRELFPESWKDYYPVYESFQAGKIGRSEIIAHGTTIDPGFFSGKPYYPISPTLGCLCAREIWDPVTGGLKESDQLKLANAFMHTSSSTGYMFVINYFNKSRPLTVEDIEPLIKAFEIGLLAGPITPQQNNAKKWSNSDRLNSMIETGME